MSPDDPRHGTYAGTSAHWSAGERPCEPCRRAGARKRKHNRYLALIGNSATVPALGTVRRIQALQALGWTHAEVAAAANLSVDAIRSPLCRGTSIYRATADGVAAAYEALSMKVPVESRNSRYCRTLAKRKGWPPPLAWDDIDDPNEQPATATGDSRCTVAPMLEDAEWLADSDLSLSAVLDRLDVTRETFRDACRRLGRSDLYWRLAGREPDGDQLRAVRDGIRRRKESA